jgi:hypothetical protein
VERQVDTSPAATAPNARPDDARQWYAEHRRDVLARLSEPSGCTPRTLREASLLVLAFDDDPSTVVCARAVRLAAS